MKPLLNRHLIMKKLWVLALILSFGLFACDNDKDADDCRDDIVCTEEFVILVGKLQYGDDDPIHLQDYKIINNDNDSIYVFGISSPEAALGEYTIITDAEMEQISKTGTTLTLIGLTQEGESFTEEFVVGHDCCHVIALSGPSQEND